MVRHITVASPHWTGEPLRIGLLADVHVGGRLVHAPRVEKIAARLNGLDPEVILLAGDFTSGTAPRSHRGPAQLKDIDAGYRALGKLSAPMGVYAVRGNHDYQYGARLAQASLEKFGIIFMDNRHKVVADRFCLFGLDDEIYGRPNLLGRRGCNGSHPMIGIMHSPDSFFRLPGGEAFVVAGHTHGGQINIPFVGRAVTSTQAGKPYAYGHIEINGTPGFVTAGIGQSILSARFRSPPEIVILTLTGE